MKIKTYLLGLLAVTLLAVSCEGQSRTNRLYRPCGGSATPAIIEVQRDGDIDLIPCAGRSVLINGGSSGAALIGTQNRFPYFTAVNTLGNSPYIYDGTNYTWNNTALNSTFPMLFTPSTQFRVGAASGFRFDMDAISSRIDGVGRFINLGDLGAALGNGTYFVLADTTRTIQLGSETLDLDTNKSFLLFRVVTAAATVGNQTINTPAGTVNFAAAASSLTVTNSTVTANSIITLGKRTNDATCDVDNYVAAAGSFVINMTAACTAETSVGFIVTN